MILSFFKFHDRYTPGFRLITSDPPALTKSICMDEWMLIYYLICFKQIRIMMGLQKHQGKNNYLDVCCAGNGTETYVSTIAILSGRLAFPVQTT